MLKRMTAAIALLATAACATAGETTKLAPISGDLLIADVTVIDPERGTRTEGQDVLVTGGRIAMVMAHDSRPIEADRTIEAAGEYLIPGLMNMHSHSSYTPLHVQTLKLMHANGVTGIREMGSDCPSGPGGMGMCLSEMRVSRAKIEAGEMVGPRMVQLSSAKISMERGDDADALEMLYRPLTPEDAEASVAGMKARGAEFLKTSENWMPNGTFEAFMAAAKEADLPVGGHIPIYLSSAEVAELGFTSIEHGRDLPMDCSTVGPEFRDHMKRKLSGEDLPWPDRKALPAAVVAGFDDAACKNQIDRLAAAGTWYVPTHLTRAMDYRASDPVYRADPRMAYIHPMQKAHWDKDLDRTSENLADIKDDLEGFFVQGLKTTKMAFDGGVRVMAGTDANDTMIFPGFSLHDEIALLVRAGLTPMQALQAATSVPAAYLGREEDFGGVSAGKFADLVLLQRDPTADIANTTSIRAVIQGGRVSDRMALDALLDEVKAWAAAATPEGE